MLPHDRVAFYRTLERAPELVQDFFRRVGAFSFFEAHHDDRAAMTGYLRRHNDAAGELDPAQQHRDLLNLIADLRGL